MAQIYVIQGMRLKAFRIAYSDLWLGAKANFRRLML